MCFQIGNPADLLPLWQRRQYSLVFVSGRQRRLRDMSCRRGLIGSNPAPRFRPYFNSPLSTLSSSSGRCRSRTVWVRTQYRQLVTALLIHSFPLPFCTPVSSQQLLPDQVCPCSLCVLRYLSRQNLLVDVSTRQFMLDACEDDMFNPSSCESRTWLEHVVGRVCWFRPVCTHSPVYTMGDSF